MDRKIIMSTNTLKKTLLKSHRATQTTNSAFSDQVSGNHYKTLKIQPLEYCMANDLNACQSHVIKYISRYDKKWKDKKDQIKDLKKAKHVIDMQIELLEKE
tara:strand:+ start:208 stop:510 length:303 start_codon:yes stop_codon:yes gene_type:complete